MHHELRTFGGLDLRDAGGEPTEALLAHSKGVALLVYLAVEAPEEGIGRSRATALLWPDREEARARNALSITLTRIRQATDPPLIEGKGGSQLRLARDRLEADVWAFREALERGDAERALSLYRGDFLASFQVTDAPSFERWVDQRRERFRDRAHEAALTEGRRARETGDGDVATAAFERALELRPFRQEAAVELVRALAERGRPAEALRRYEAFCERREAELDLPPSEELEALVERIRAGEVEPRVAEVGEPPEAGETPEPTTARPEGGTENGGELAASSGVGEPEATETEGRIGRRSSFFGVAVLTLVVVAVGLWRWGVAAGGGESERPVADRSVAVLPFEVSGSGADEWRDGMVTLLNTNLEGAAGLRTIPDRTVFSVWQRSGRAGEGASAREALAVAREVGAQYALVGSAVQVGGELRFVADVHETVTGDRLGQAVVRGSPDSVTSLTDDLTRRVLGILLQESGEELPSVNLASMTTRSLAALKSYLAGERHFRLGDYDAAIEDYKAAIAGDSNFALAYARLGLAQRWSSQVSVSAADVFRQAYELSDQLPRRERRIVRAISRWQVQSLTAVDSLRRFTKDYPDDARVWYWLGETLTHGFVPEGWPEAEGALRRAVELEPDMTYYHHHLVDLTLSLYQDSALASRRIEAHPEGVYKKMYRAVWTLKYGTDDRRRSARRLLDTLPIPLVTNPYFGGWPLLHPTDLQLQAQVIRRLAERDDTEFEAFRRTLAFNRLLRGQVEQALPHLERTPKGQSCWLAVSALSLGYPVPDSVLRLPDGPSLIEEDPTLGRLKCVGVYLIESGRPEQLDQVLASLRDRTAETTHGEVRISQAADELRGYRAWKEGDLERAAELWSGYNASFTAGALWRGDLYRVLGEKDKAKGWYRAAWRHPVAHERLGHLYEEMDRPGNAAAAYRRFVAAWKDADPELQGRVEEARKRLQELKGAGSETDD